MLSIPAGDGSAPKFEFGHDCKSEGGKREVSWDMQSASCGGG
jgi:hypothetical protein